MFSVRFRVLVRVRHRRKDFCFWHQNHLRLTLDIWDKGSVGLGKCSGWPFHNLHLSEKHLKQKGSKQKGSTPVWYSVNYVTSTFDPTLDLDPGFKVKFWNSCISGIDGLVGMKGKRSKSIGFWTEYVTLPFDLEPWMFKVNVWNSLISGMVGPI